MNTPLIIIHLIICIIIIFIVLLQVGRGAEAGAVFGGAGQAQTPRGTTTFIGKFTAGVAIAFMLTSFLLTYQTSNTAKQSVTEKIARDKVQTEAPATANTSEKESNAEGTTQPASSD